MRSAATILLLIAAAFACYWSVGLGFGLLAAAIAVGRRITLRDEEGFSAGITAMAFVGIVVEAGRQALLWITARL